MHKIQKHIEIVRTSTKGLSSMSIDSANILHKTLKRTYAKVGITDIANKSDLDELAKSRPDLAFLGMKRLPVDGDDIWISDFLDRHNIAYTGSARSAHELELDKSLAKQRVLDAGLMTSPFLVISNEDELKEKNMLLPYPVFIKPLNRGGGAGVDDKSVAYDFTELKAKVQSIRTKYGASSLVERFLNGREFSVAVMRKMNSDDYMAMPIELIAPIDEHGNRLLSSAVKSSDTEEFVAVTDPDLRKALSGLAIGAFQALGARDYGRIDIRMDSAGTPHFLEANLIPSILKDYGNFPKACMINEGIDYEETVLRIIDLAFERTPEDASISAIQSALFAPRNLAA